MLKNVPKQILLNELPPVSLFHYMLVLQNMANVATLACPSPHSILVAV